MANAPNETANRCSEGMGTHADVYGCACVCKDAIACSMLQGKSHGGGVERCGCLCHKWAAEDKRPCNM